MNVFRSHCYASLFAVTLMAATSAGHAQTIKADHTTVEVSALSSSIDAARALRMNFSHASVGGNIWGGLEALAADSKYAFPNWSDNNRGNPGWAAKITEFESWVASHSNDFDVFQNKFCYIDQDANFATYRDSMLALAKKYPAKVFVWWTMPLMTDGSDNALRAAFNRQVRDYCKTNNLPLFDVADIESHDTKGAAIANSGNEALDPAQSSDGGHLNDTGAARAAKAQWALMTQLAAAKPGGAGAGGAGNTGGSGTPSNAGTSTGSDGDAGANNVATTGGSSDDSGCTVGAMPHRSALLWMLGAALGFVALSRRRGA